MVFFVTKLILSTNEQNDLKEINVSEDVFGYKIWTITSKWENNMQELCM